MSEGRLLADGAAIVTLARRLAQCPEVCRHSSAEHDEPSTLAHAFADLEESFEAFRRALLPKLVAGSADAQADYQVLLDIGEEFRHVLYHIGDTRFYRYLQPPEGQSSGRESSA